MTDTIIIKEIKFNHSAFCSMSKQVATWIAKGDTNDLSDKVSALTDIEGLNLIKQYVDHHSENLDGENAVAMKPLKPSVHQSIADVFKEFDPWDGEFIDGLDHNQRTKLKNIAEELHMMALIDKICIYIAFHMTQSLNTAKVESLDEAKMIKIFLDDLNIVMPNRPAPKIEVEPTE
jgi:hypothetical protein